MKEVYLILENLELPQRAKVLEYLTQLEEDCTLLKDEQKDLLSSLNLLYNRNQQLHERLNELSSRPGGNRLIELMEENKKLRLQLQQSQNTLDSVSALLDI